MAKFNGFALFTAVAFCVAVFVALSAAAFMLKKLTGSQAYVDLYANYGVTLSLVAAAGGYMWGEGRSRKISNDGKNEQ